MAKRHRPGRGAARLFAHVEDVLVAATGEDAFEIVFAVAAALLLDRTRRDIAVRIAAVARSHRALDVKAPRRTPGELLERVAGLIAKAVSSAPSELEALDAIFEALVPRVAKSDKGQFFTPRHVVDFVVTALDVRAGERVADPSCGSGAFLSRAVLSGSTWSENCARAPFSDAHALLRCSPCSRPAALASALS